MTNIRNVTELIKDNNKLKSRLDTLMKKNAMLRQDIKDWKVMFREATK